MMLINYLRVHNIATLTLHDVSNINASTQMTHIMLILLQPNFVIPNVGPACTLAVLRTLYQQYKYTRKGFVLSPATLITALKGSDE